MHSQVERRLLAAMHRIVGLLSLTLCLLTASGQPARGQPSIESGRPVRSQTIDGDRIARALKTVKADPNLAAEITIKTLRLKPRPPSTGSPWWVRWFGALGAIAGWSRGFFNWFEQGSRMLLWAGVAVLVAGIAGYVARLWLGRSPFDAQSTLVAPSHVRGLDVRPESLPADIGGAARALWDASQHRPAISLLYRGLLSRLVHAHGLALRASSTEGDCLALAAGHFSGMRLDYVARLIDGWQRFVYGGETMPSTVAYHLCDGFRGALDAPSTIDRSSERAR